MDDRKRQGKSTENVGLFSKVEPLKLISCGHCGKPAIYRILPNTRAGSNTKKSRGALVFRSNYI